MKTALQVLLGFQVIFTALAATDETFAESDNGDEGEVIGNIQPLEAAVDENIHPNDDDGNIVQLNVHDSENELLNDEIQYGEVQELKQQDIPHSNKKDRGIKLKNIKPLSWYFKYAMDKKDEPGFDLTPEEMKKFKIWKDGVIPYYIDVVSFSDKVLRDKIRNHLQLVNSITSINFVELPGPPSDDTERWVFFMNRRGLLGCADHAVNNFTNEGVQQVVLGYDCIATRGEIAEAVMSILGVPAQHNAPNRDKYITVNLENIMPDKKYLFEKLNDDKWLFHELDYDFNSITHYNIHKHSANGRATIELKKTSDDLNPDTTFSATDLQKIKMLYNFITKNNKIQTTVCEKLFKISSKLKPGPSMSQILNPRKKPSQYLSLTGSGSEIKEKTENKNRNKSETENKDQNEDNNVEEEISNKENHEVHADNGEKLDNDHNNENKKDENYVAGNIDSQNPAYMLHGYGYKVKRQKKYFTVSTPKFMTYEEILKNDPLLAISDYQAGAEGMKK